MQGQGASLVEEAVVKRGGLALALRQQQEVVPLEGVFRRLGKDQRVPSAAWGRMAIVDTKPFKLRVILHRIFVERPQVTGIPAWPGGAACYRRSRYIL